MNKLKDHSLHFILTAIILLLSISCQNCTSSQADNNAVKKDTINKADSTTVSENTWYEDKEDTISKLCLLGKITPSKDTNFILVDSKYSWKKNYMRKEAYKAFIKMYDVAKKEGISLSILSATRTFNEQKNIWEGKWTGKVMYYGKNIATSYPDSVERSTYVLKYSSMPGTSRHHWGTDIDLNSMELAYYKSETGKKLYSWLSNNASKFGFCQPYTEKDSSRMSGYEEEKWHWSYFPLSSKFLKQYKERITYDDLKGFAGWQTARKISIIKNYVLSVNTKCQ
jgi:zinc D-Ala-D-Ala carboxypeptidase